MSEKESNPGIDVLVNLDLYKLKNKLRRKIMKSIENNKFGVYINVDVYDISPDIEIFTDSIASYKRKNKKTKKS